MDRYGNANESTWCRVRAVHGRPSWEDLYNEGMACYNWLQSDAYARSYANTGTTGSCLVAVGCYDWGNGGDYYIYTCTIPRGVLRDHFTTNGPHAATDWYRAATAARQPLVLHAEDGMLARMNEEMRSLRSRGEPIRMLVVGSYGGGTAGRAFLCNNPRLTHKNPSCADVARGVGAKVLPNNKSPKDMDNEEAQRRSGAGSSHAGPSGTYGVGAGRGAAPPAASRGGAPPAGRGAAPPAGRGAAPPPGGRGAAPPPGRGAAPPAGRPAAPSAGSSSGRAGGSGSLGGLTSGMSKLGLGSKPGAKPVASSSSAKSSSKDAGKKKLK